MDTRHNNSVFTNALIDGFKGDDVRWVTKPIPEKVKGFQSALACDNNESKVLFMYIPNNQENGISSKEAFDFIVEKFGYKISYSDELIYFADMTNKEPFSGVAVHVYKYNLEQGAMAF